MKVPERPLAIFLALQALLLNAAAIEDNTPRHDFSALYAAGLAVRQGDPKALYARAGGSELTSDRLVALRERGYAGDYALRFYYHPFWAILAAPLTTLSYAAAVRLFLGLGVLALVGWTAALVRRGELSWLGGAALLIAVSLFYPHRTALDYGQLSVFMLPVVGLVVARPSSRLSGVLLGLVLLARPFLWPVFALLAIDRRGRRAAIAGCTTVAAATLVAALFLGSDSLLGFASVLEERGHRWISIYAGAQSLLHQLHRLIMGTSLEAEVHEALVPMQGTVLAAYYAGALGILAATWAAARQVSKLPGRAAIASLGALLASPFSWTHYFATLFVPALWVLKRGDRAAQGLAVAALLLCNLPLRYSSGLTRLLAMHCFLGAVLMGVAVARSLWRRRDAA